MDLKKYVFGTGSKSGYINGESAKVFNIEEIKARGGNIYVIRTNTDTELIEDEYSISVPDVSEYFLPFISVIPIQLLAYHIALLRKTNIDTPRHIAKSVTVE